MRGGQPERRGPSANFAEGGAGPRVAYPGRSRVGKDRADLIETLRTVQALEENGHATRLIPHAPEAVVVDGRQATLR